MGTEPRGGAGGVAPPRASSGSCGPEAVQSHSLIPCDWLLPAAVYKQDSVGGNRCFIRSQGSPSPSGTLPGSWGDNPPLQVGTVGHVREGTYPWPLRGVEVEGLS